MNIKKAKHLLATNMKFYRKSLRLSQEQLAKKVGIHRTYIGGIEQEKRNPSLNNIVKIANNLNVEIKDLFRERERERLSLSVIYPVLISIFFKVKISNYSWL